MESSSTPHVRLDQARASLLGRSSARDVTLSSEVSSFAHECALVVFTSDSFEQRRTLRAAGSAWDNAEC